MTMEPESMVYPYESIEKGVMLKGEVVHLRPEGFGLKFLSLLKDGKEVTLKL
jgi:hypothetical protein